jgi:hypothetical protein
MNGYDKIFVKICAVPRRPSFVAPAWSVYQGCNLAQYCCFFSGLGPSFNILKWDHYVSVACSAPVFRWKCILCRVPGPGIWISPFYRTQQYAFSPEEGSRASCRNIVVSFLEYWTMEQVQRHSNSECFAPSVEPFRLICHPDVFEMIAISFQLQKLLLLLLLSLLFASHRLSPVGKQSN